MDQFIQLNRKFYMLSADYTRNAENDDIDIREALGLHIGDDTGWDDLQKEHRVILLAEAGAGKTHEIRHAAQSLRAQGKPAFFLRLEHITSGIETAFEEGSYKEFQDWINSDEEGWILLDSVDEAKLKDPKDFERAIKKIALLISQAIPRTHLIISSRVIAWRPKTDLALCNTQFPFSIPDEQGEIAAEDSNDSEDDIFSDTESQKAKKHKSSSNEEKQNGFKVYSLTDLSRGQVTTFIKAKNIENDVKFLDEIERQDAWAYTRRPEDLDELVKYWNDKKKIGTRLDLIEHSVERRIKEREEDRDTANPLSLQKAREGAQKLAAACTFMHQSAITVPDGTANPDNLDAKSILTDWDTKDCKILLDRPVFDPAIYGAVRFHHRSVREYLTAKWIFEKLKENGSRKKIEDLFFRTQHGLQVVIPSMKPILSWLVLFDPKIMQKVFKLEPEIILEGGDPSKLPLENRKEILHSVCQKIASGTSSRSVDDRAAVQRFASADMADDIKLLIEKYKDNKEVVSYLLRMIWHGGIKEALPEAKFFALNPNTDKYSRIAAIRAVKILGSKNDFDEILNSFLLEKEPYDRRLLAELIDHLPSDEKAVPWISKALEKVEDKEKYESGGLSYALNNFISRSSTNISVELLKVIDPYLKKEPFIARSFCEVSERYSWMMPISAKAIEKLITTKHSFALSAESLFVLTKIPAFKEYNDFESTAIKKEFSELIPKWEELNHDLFWNHVHESRLHLEPKINQPITWYSQMLWPHGYWRFDGGHFDLIIKDIKSREILDDKLMAVSLAFQLYKDNNRSKAWLNELKKAVSGEKNLEERLEILLHPPKQTEETKKWKRQEAHWKRRHAEQKKRIKEDKEKSLEWLNQNYEKLKNNGLERGKSSQPQQYMYQRMRELAGENSSRWAEGNWKALIDTYGMEIASAFRDGMLNFWRTYTPELRSENDQDDGTPFSLIFGLSGLAVESAENPNWLDNVNEKEAELAFRYASHELNAFPNWFVSLHKKFPDLINKLILGEIKWELEAEDPKHKKYYMLSKISWDCKWLWNDLAPQLLQMLEKEPLNAENLSSILKIAQRSSTVSDDDIAKLAEAKCKTVNSLDNVAYWYAAWIGVDPENGIKALTSYLEKLNQHDPESATNLAMQLAVNLTGERRTESNSREKFKTPAHLKDLYLLMHKYIRTQDDINRAGKGAYSPELRDDAQDARSKFFSSLSEIKGKESYLAMLELAEIHPDQEARRWMMHSAKSRAELDADFAPWEGKKFCEFSKTLESAPSNHRELFDLAVQRIVDLKYQLEEGDDSIASTLAKENEERGIRKVIANYCREKSIGRYTIAQEDELADGKKPDCRFMGSSFDAPVPMELKLADNWSGPDLFERLENQLNSDYLRDERSNCGVFVLVYRGEKQAWEIPEGKAKANFSELIEELQNHWNNISNKYPKIDQITVIGIDLTKRVQSPSLKIANL